MITNQQSGTSLDEIARGIYRISTPVQVPGGAFSFNQYLIAADKPLVFHTGPRRMFPLVSEAIARVVPLEKLRYIAFSHFEADECGALTDFLDAAPRAEPVCSAVAKLVSVDDQSPRPARALADGETLDLGSHSLRWYDAPHVPHGWECGFMMEATTSTLLCGDIFTQPGDGKVAISTGDIVGPSEAMRKQMDYWTHAPQTRATLERLAQARPKVLACMHGSAWHGDGARLLRELADAVTS